MRLLGRHETLAIHLGLYMVYGKVVDSVMLSSWYGLDDEGSVAGS